MSEHNEPWKPTAAQLREAVNKTVPDLIAPGLRVLFVGINPGLYTAAIGHHFGRPGNRFWPALHGAGFTPRPVSPFDERELPGMGLGITNLVPRATARADELTNEELVEGAKAVEAKVRKYRPKVVAFVGVSAYRVAFNRPKAKVGRQGEPVGGAVTWVLPNPSGLNAHYQAKQLAEVFGELRRAVEEM